MRILFAGGGSIGHIAPCVAVWRAVQASNPNTEAHMICSERPEDAAFLEQEKIPFTAITAWKLLRQSPLVSLAAFRKARALIDEWKPDVVFCKGGAVSVPVAWAAKRTKTPIVLHESDAVSGRANRLIARWAKVVCLGFPSETGDVLQKKTSASGKFFVTGNPTRASITKGSRVRGLALTGFSGTRPILLVMGGSQGAETLNRAVLEHLPAILAQADVIHLTGKGKRGADVQPGYWPRAFAQEELADLYAITNLALSRAGAGSIAELAANGVPAVLVPLPGLAQDHQTANAKAAEATGGCTMLSQTDLATTLLPTLTRLLADAPARAQMSEHIRTLSRPDAADLIAAILHDAANATSLS